MAALAASTTALTRSTTWRATTSRTNRRRTRIGRVLWDPPVRPKPYVERSKAVAGEGAPKLGAEAVVAVLERQGGHPRSTMVASSIAPWLSAGGRWARHA